MPGDNCSIFGCTVSRRAKYKGIAIFKVPTSDNTFDSQWRKKLIAIVTKDRVVDKALRDRIANKRIFICQRHFNENQYYRHESRVTLNPGELPCLNLPIKSIPSSSTITKPRESSQSTLLKRAQHPPPEIKTPEYFECYQSFSEFSSRIQNLRLAEWQYNYSENSVQFYCNDDIHMVPKYEIYVDTSLQFNVRVLLWSLPKQHQIYNIYDHSVKNITISNLIRYISGFFVCPGLPRSFSGSCIEHTAPKKFNPTIDILPNPLSQTKWHRPPSCQLLINTEDKCEPCLKAECREKLSLQRKQDNLSTPAHDKAPVSLTSPDRIKLKLQSYRIENKQLKADKLKMMEEIVQKAVPVDDSLSKDMMNIMSNADYEKMPEFMQFFWSEQQKYLSSSKTAVRYHPMIIRYCLGLAAKSPSFYDEIRYDEKTKAGFVILPSRRRLRDYKNYIRPQQGFNKDVILELKKIVENFSDIERYGIVLMDEIKIQEKLVWDKHTGDLIGYVDLGDMELNLASLQKSDDIASHMLVFLIRSIVNPLKFSLANFATTNATSVQLFTLFWKAVGILEDNCGIKVVGVTSDGASPNRSMYRMHFNMTRVEDVNGDVDVTYRTLNVMATEKRYIYFISDPPHLIKTARNCLANSMAGRCTRSMWNNGKYLTWNHISKLFFDDLDCGLHLVPKITNNHIKLTPFSVMNVRLAAQVLSESVFHALQTYGPPEAEATATFCMMMDKFFDCLNIRNTKEGITKAKSFLKPFESQDDERFTWLLETFLKYFSDWKDSIATRPGNFTDNAKSNMFISWQTYEGIKITTYSSIELIKYLLSHGVPYVLTERFCQDPLENYFGRQRSMGHRKDNPTVRDFGYNDNTIRTQKIFRPIAGNCIDNEAFAKIDVESMPCRKKKK